MQRRSLLHCQIALWKGSRGMSTLTCSGCCVRTARSWAATNSGDLLLTVVGSERPGQEASAAYVCEDSLLTEASHTRKAGGSLGLLCGARFPFTRAPPCDLNHFPEPHSLPAPWALGVSTWTERDPNIQTTAARRRGTRENAITGNVSAGVQGWDCHQHTIRWLRD